MLLELVGTAVETTLASPMSDTDMSFTIVSADGWPDGASGNPFPVTIGKGSSAEEKMLCSSRTGTTVTVSERGYDETTAAAHAAGVEVIHSISAAILAEVLAHANDDTNDVHAQYAKRASNLSDLASAATARTNLGLGSAAIHAHSEYDLAGAAAAAQAASQPLDADLTAIAASVTAFALTLLDDANASAALTTLGVSTFIKTLLDDADAATARATLGITTSSASTVVVKTSDESVTSSTTLQDDDVLLAAVSANTNYVFTGWLYWTQASATPDLKVAFTVPTGASVEWSWADNEGNNLAPVTTSGGATGPGFSGSTGWVRIDGSVRVGSTAGNLQLQFAQIVSSAVAIVVKAGSWLRCQAAS